MEHWLQGCPNLRQRTFGSPSPPLGVLTADPEKVLALARATFYRALGTRITKNNNSTRLPRSIKQNTVGLWSKAH